MSLAPPRSLLTLDVLRPHSRACVRACDRGLFLTYFWALSLTYKRDSRVSTELLTALVAGIENVLIVFRSDTGCAFVVVCCIFGSVGVERV